MLNIELQKDFFLFLFWFKTLGQKAVVGYFCLCAWECDLNVLQYGVGREVRSSSIGPASRVNENGRFMTKNNGR